MGFFLYNWGGGVEYISGFCLVFFIQTFWVFFWYLLGVSGVWEPRVGVSQGVCILARVNPPPPFTGMPNQACL